MWKRKKLSTRRRQAVKQLGLERVESRALMAADVISGAAALSDTASEPVTAEQQPLLENDQAWGEMSVSISNGFLKLAPDVSPLASIRGAGTDLGSVADQDSSQSESSAWHARLAEAMKEVQLSQVIYWQTVTGPGHVVYQPPGGQLDTDRLR